MHLESFNKKETQEGNKITLKVINPSQKRDYKIVNFRLDNIEMLSFEDIKDTIMSNFPVDMSVPRVNDLELGFIEPGHGLKGMDHK